MIVRRARPADVGEIHRLIHALAVHEGAADAVAMRAEDLARHMFGETPAVFAHVAEADGAIGGIAVWFVNFSTWTGRRGLYLEDLFVAPALRGRGVARALFGAVAREALAQGCVRVDWAVLAHNDAAKAAYRRLGGALVTDWETWRIEGDALHAAAGG